MDDKLLTRIDKTTALQHLPGTAVGRKKYISNGGNSCDFDTTVKYWKSIWESFKEDHSRDRQLYRELFDQYELFFYSFQKLDILSFPEDTILYNQKVTKNYSFLASMYLCGKKTNDIIKELNPIFHAKNNLDSFSFTRNSFFEHNFNTQGFPNVFFKVNKSTISNTDGYLIIDFHKGENECIEKYYLDYLNDFYTQQDAMIRFLKQCRN